jgi:hypothetical protein
MSNTFENSRRILGAALACFMLAALSTSIHAQTCTVNNWDAVSADVVNGDNDATGSVGSPPTFKRYAGPCSLRATFGGVAEWVENDQGGALDESNYIARFYVYLTDVAGTNVPLFEAYDGTNAALFAVLYSDTLSIGIDTNGSGTPNVAGDAQTGWNSVEIEYDGTNLSASINGAADISAPTDLMTNVASVRLGDIDGGVGSGVAYFDDFDSRRVSRPGRLCRGLTDESRDLLTFADAIAIFTDAVSPVTVVAGQPDYNEDGLVTFSDAITVFNQAVNPANRSCDQNR